MTHDDPKLTAYALGELDDAADRAAVEALLASDESARRFVDETRQTAAALARGLQTPNLPTLTPAQRQAIASARTETAPAPAPARRLWVRWALATAACAALATAGFSVFSHRNLGGARHQIAQSDPKALEQEVRRQEGGAALADVQTQPGAGPGASWGEPKNEVASRYFEQLANAPAMPGQQQGGQQGQQAAQGQQGQGGRGGQSNSGGRAPADPQAATERFDDRGKLSFEKQAAGTVNGGTVALDGLAPGTSKPGGDASATAPPGTTWDMKRAGAVWAGDSVLVKKTDERSLSAATPAPTTPAPAPTEPTAKPEVAALGSRPMNGPVVSDAPKVPAKPQPPALPAGAPPAQQPGSAPQATAQPQSIRIRKQESVYRLHQRLKDVRDAAARNDAEAAQVALADARKELEDRVDQLTPAERAEATTALRLTEAQVPGTESYAKVNDNPFHGVADQPLSTFSIDVDTASYANVRRFINGGHLPPADAVRIEELLNYFPYAYEPPAPDSKDPFKAHVEVATCPWNTSHRLARVAIKGREIAHDKRPVSNLVFLIDVSGSMNEPKKLPLVKEGLKLLVNELNENDRISLVVYAGSAGLVLPSTPADPKNKPAILAAIDNLSAGGSTNGGQGIELAYRTATENFIKGGTNRVILATDGDWNVGITDQTSLTHLIETQAKSGVFLSLLGFGYGNLKDSTLERLADKGNGHYDYIDDLREARKVLVEQMSGTLVTIAKDVKIQVEFNPSTVQSYRLIGYENRMLKKEDFNNDKVDAGEIGAGHTVTALYEIVPATRNPRASTSPAGSAVRNDSPSPAPDVDPLKYQKTQILNSEELLTLKLRYKQPDGDASALLQTPVTDRNLSYAKASEDFKFAAAVAQYGMILRSSPHKGTATLDAVLELADEGKGKDDKGHRADFLDLVKKTKALAK